MHKDAARIVCLIVLAIGVGASLAACVARARLEAANRTVAVLLDYDQVRALASVGGLTTPAALTRMKAAGATHVAITEQTLHDVLSSGEVASVPIRPQDAAGAVPVTASLVGPPGAIGRIRRSLVERMGLGRRTAEIVARSPRADRLNIGIVSPADLADLGIGYPRTAVQEVNQAGLQVVPRPRAEGNQWAAASSASLNLAEELNARLLVFSGNAAPGYPDNIPGVAREFEARGLVFGYVEFGKQYGDMALAGRLPDSFIRVHSINETEMLGMSVQRALDRFVLAVRERNIRACYVRLFAPSGEEPVASAEAYIGKLIARLRSHGYQLGTPRPYDDLGAPPWLRWLAMLGPLAAAGLCLIELLGCRPVAALIALAAAAVLTLVGVCGALTLTAKVCALLAAIALPPLAVGRYRPPANAFLSRWPGLGKGLLLFAASSGVSMIGGLLVIGCLADYRFMVKLDQFSGVKLAHILPLAAIFALQLGWDAGAAGAREGERPLTTLFRGWRTAAESAVRYWHAALLLIAVAALGLLVLRTGNESGLGVSSLELQFRAALDRVFGVRPRTKEVLIGHPLLVLGLARAAVGKNSGRWLLLSLGAIGQVSLVNTFSHLHTPVVISLARTLHGLWFGALMGVGLFIVTELAERVWGSIREKLCAEESRDRE